MPRFPSMFNKNKLIMSFWELATEQLLVMESVINWCVISPCKILVSLKFAVHASFTNILQHLFQSKRIRLIFQYSIMTKRTETKQAIQRIANYIDRTNRTKMATTKRNVHTLTSERQLRKTMKKQTKKVTHVATPDYSGYRFVSQNNKQRVQYSRRGDDN